MATKIFLKLDGVLGESKTPLHFGEIEILSWEWSSRQTLALGLSQKAIKDDQSNDLTLTKAKDRTSPILLEACLSGRSFNQAMVTIENYLMGGKSQQLLALKLKTVVITSIGTKDNSGGEFVTLNFEKVETMSR